MGLAKLLMTFNEEKVVVEKNGKYVEKDVDGISLKGVLQRGRLKLSKKGMPVPQGLTFSPSSITYNYCRRAKIGQLARVVDLYYDKPRPALQVTFDMGHAIHDIFQGYFWDLGILKGSFHCLKCDKTYDNLQAPQSCPSGKVTHTRKHLIYKEVKATNVQYLISGRCDGILDIEGENHVLDIKSIANRTPDMQDRGFCFEDLAKKGPKPEHVVQLTFYMWILQIPRGHLLYVSKNKQQIKSFAIPYNESIIEPYLSEIKEIISKAQTLKEGKKVELPKPCDDENCPCAQVPSIIPNTQEVKI